MTTSVDQCVRAAQWAFEKARDVPPARRAAWLSAVADAIEGAREELVALAREESSLPVGRLDGELTRTAFQLRLLGSEAASGLPLQATIDHAAYQDLPEESLPPALQSANPWAIVRRVDGQIIP